MDDNQAKPVPVPVPVPVSVPVSAPRTETDPLQLLFLLRHNLLLVERGVKHSEPRFIARVLRSLSTTRSYLGLYPNVLAAILNEATPPDSPTRSRLAALLPAPYQQPSSVPVVYAQPAEDRDEDKGKDRGKDKDKDKDAMDIDPPASSSTMDNKGAADAEKPDTAADKNDDKPALPQHWLPHRPVPDAAPELEAYLCLLVIVLSLDENKIDQAAALSQASLATVTSQNRRSLDQIGARTVFYLGRCIELNKAAGKGPGLAGERSALLNLHRTSALRHDTETTATVLNLLLRSYLVDSNLYDQADKLVARAPFPRAQASNGQIARYDYYVGRIRAVQLNYTEAHTHLQQAIRRAPQPGQGRGSPVAASKDGDAPASAAEPDRTEAAEETTVAAGFLQTAYKFLVVVELLMGDIPERSIFRQALLRRALAPYMEIVQAVRVGDLARFQASLSLHGALFQSDKTYSLILRLRHNVIKTGIRSISLAYSRIGLHDVTRKLRLESEEDAEYIVAKAIRDGVIEARVDHERAEMVSSEERDVYVSNEPMVQFQQRIAFCLQLHNESVKAMRYPLNSHKAELDSASAAHERERELAKEIADGDLDDDDDDWP